LAIDKDSTKIKEIGIFQLLLSFIDVLHREEDSDWMIEIEGLLGIVEILGVNHLMVIIAK
jgi:hypothetical protein